jgi:hypothetical protein
MIVYLTTNLVNNKKYIGIDTKNNLEYFGSGLYIKKAIKKYGKENFRKEVLEICENKEDLLNSEIKWILFYDAVNSKDFYNIHPGGQGGDIRTFLTEEEEKLWCDNISKGKKGLKKGVPLSDLNKAGISDGLKKYYDNGGKAPLEGKSHSEETKEKISKSNMNKIFSEEHLLNLRKANKNKDVSGEKNPFWGKGDQVSGSKNPMYGKTYYQVWVEKYGKEVADKKLLDLKIKLKESRIKK